MAKEINKLRVAVIDMNNGTTNLGLKGIQEILLRYQQEKSIEISYDLFNLRQKGEFPGMDYDIYISSGGPGSPYEGEGQSWEANFFDLLDAIENYNTKEEHKKHVFLICHSFQMACRKYDVGKVVQRRSTAFGIFPVSLTPEGENDPVFKGLSNPFYAVDSRNWQVIDPEASILLNEDVHVLAIEKERPHVNLERCIMAVRFTKEIIGTQFHPEAGPVGMKQYLMKKEKKQAIIETYGHDKYQDMLESVDDPVRISLTQNLILPNFLNEALNTLKEA